MHVHGVVGHVHHSNHNGIVVSWGRDCWFLAYDYVALCVFLGLENMGYLMYSLIMSSYAKAFYMWVCACG